MAENTPPSLSTLISVAEILSGSSGKAVHSPDIATVLKSRLARAYEIFGEDSRSDIEGSDLAKLQYITAKESLRLVENVQNLIDPIDSGLSASGDTPPLLGTRDLSHIRTLLSIVFKWAIEPLITELELTRPGPGTPASTEPRIIDLTERQLDFEELPSLTSRLLVLAFGPGLSGKIRQTWITTSILSHHAVEMLTPCLIIGWSLKPVSDTFARSSKDIKALSIRFTNVLRSHEAIAALGTILSSIATKRARFIYVPKACAHLLSNQLKRPDGVRGLCTAIFGEGTEEAEVAPLDKLEHIAKVLRTVPSAAKPEDYYRFMIPRILELLLPSSSQQTPPSHKRAAAFALSGMLSPTFQHHAIASAILLPLLHEPFLSPKKVNSSDETASLPSSQPVLHLAPAEALRTLQELLLHTDPSPTELSTLLTPIVPELYTLVSLYRSNKTADPNVRESLSALLNTWGRIVTSSDAIVGLWSIVTGSGGNWELGLEGFTRSAKPGLERSISLVAAAELQAGSQEDVDIHANPFNLRPDPSEFVAFLKTLDRKDVSSEVFVKLLTEYRKLKENDADPMRTLLYLQLILQVQSQLSATILSKPEHVLSFIKHALGSEPQPSSSQSLKSTPKRGLGLVDLRIVEPEDPDVGDSDDEEEGDDVEDLADSAGSKDEMVVTAITLLLSILEGNSDISPRNSPDLNDILMSLEHLTSHTSPAIRPLAREARLVLTARTASTSSAAPLPTPEPQTESGQAIYQKALKLLQDPIIPVRAHGLQLLRDLVSRPSSYGSRGPDKPQLDAALVPGILSIFLQSLQDDESYVFLNAVQGLAAMVDGYGREVLRRVVDVYLRGTGVGGSDSGSGAMSREELDARVRVGEALNAVVKRCGSGLGLYVDILVPPLLTILRAAHLPTTLRTSALSILAQCVNTHALALNTYTAGLADACVELVQLESVAAKSQSERAKDHREVENHDDGEAVNPAVRAPELTDTDATTTDAKIAPLRRAALHFLALLLRSHIEGMYDARASPASMPQVTLGIGGTRVQAGEAAIPEGVLKRAGLVLGYVAATDGDAVTRVMAREAAELVGQYREAGLGF